MVGVEESMGHFLAFEGLFLEGQGDFECLFLEGQSD